MEKLDTVKTRLEIGFPGKMEDFAKAPAIYDKHTLHILDHPVMEDWEKPYMERLADIATENGGDVLEVGYGMGISARAIQSHPIKSHSIIECNLGVAAKCLEEFPDAIASGKIKVLNGFWQKITPILGSETFDGILFDTYPLTDKEIHSNHFPFFVEAHRLLKPGGVLTYYSDESEKFSESHLATLFKAGFKKEDISSEICPVEPPEDCQYWQDKTIMVPIVRKSNGR